MNHRERGTLGENIAADYLPHHDYMLEFHFGD